MDWNTVVLQIDSVAIAWSIIGIVLSALMGFVFWVIKLKVTKDQENDANNRLVQASLNESMLKLKASLDKQTLSCDAMIAPIKQLAVENRELIKVHEERLDNQERTLQEHEFKFKQTEKK